MSSDRRLDHGVGQSIQVAGKGDDILALLRAAALVHAQLDAMLRPTELTVDRWRALLFVQRNPGCSMVDLIDSLVIPSTSATRIVDALVDLGAAFRAPDPGDRRRVTLRISAQGQAMLTALAERIASVELPELSAKPLR